MENLNWMYTNVGGHSFMTQLTLVLILIAIHTAHGQKNHDGLIGAYQANRDSFERYSILVLQGNQRLTYKYGLGGCQGEISGTWIVKGKRLIMTNDKEFLGNETVLYPDMSLANWTIRKRGVRPSDIVDSGCIKETGIHLRMK